ncbi:DNA-repair protein XRCC1 [Camponotus floridanus]|uniref:DNA-repair protein XRCC1 n=1 Tax=Camponotus floridanus TaxID=104421 RepID=E2ACE2_CAMFO|nr:DNA-repair protein XRCC1 [Camponotus floridanus]
MIVKFEKIISCSSEHPTYPAANLLQCNSENWKATWRCAKPGEMLAQVIFQLVEPSYITGVDIGNFQSCVVIVTGSTSSEPDNWIVIVNHKFMTNDEAANNKSDSTVDLGLDVFGRFKLKQPHVMKTPMEMMKEKILNKTENKKIDYKDELREQIKRNSMENFAKCQEEPRSIKRPLLEKLEAGEADEVFKKNDKNDKTQPQDSQNKNKTPKNNRNIKNEKTVVKTPFGDIVPLVSNDTNQNDTKDAPKNSCKKRALSKLGDSLNNGEKKRQKCSNCCKDSQDQLCKTCQRLPLPPVTVENTTLKTNVSVKPKKRFKELFSNATFSLSGYVNPQRDEIRRKALNMGAKYIPDPNTTNKKCTYLICAFKNTPKYQQFKNHTKIVSHVFIEECFDKKIRFPWRRYALDQKDKLQPESEEEIDGNQSESVYDMDTDADSDY